MNNDSLASFAIECALDAGCNEAKVTVNSELSDSVEWRNNELDYVSEPNRATSP